MLKSELRKYIIALKNNLITAERLYNRVETLELLSKRSDFNNTDTSYIYKECILNDYEKLKTDISEIEKVIPRFEEDLTIFEIQYCSNNSVFLENHNLYDEPQELKTENKFELHQKLKQKEEHLGNYHNYIIGKEKLLYSQYHVKTRINRILTCLDEILWEKEIMERYNNMYYFFVNIHTDVMNVKNFLNENLRKYLDIQLFYNQTLLDIYNIKHLLKEQNVQSGDPC
jgi:hypothetical protein